MDPRSIHIYIVVLPIVVIYSFSYQLGVFCLEAAFSDICVGNSDVESGGSTYDGYPGAGRVDVTIDDGMAHVLE